MLGDLRGRIPPEPAGNRLDATLSRHQIKVMRRAGVTIGSHTQTHQILTSLPEDAVREELERSKTELEETLHAPVRAFAYPNGNHAERVRKLVAEAGYELAFTMERGAWTTTCDPLRIPRINVAEDDVTGPRGNFSSIMFDYTVFWRAWRSTRS